jgi:hypothetical protein
LILPRRRFYFLSCRWANDAGTHRSQPVRRQHLDVCDKDFGKEPDLDATRTRWSEADWVIISTNDTQVHDAANNHAFVGVCSDDNPYFNVLCFNEEGELAN